MAKYQISKGDDFTTQLTITDQDGSAVDLTGGTVVFTLYDRNGDTLHAETVTAHTTPGSGVTTISIDDLDTATFPFGCYDYEAQLTTAGGVINTVQRGQFEVTP